MEQLLFGILMFIFLYLIFEVSGCLAAFLGQHVLMPLGRALFRTIKCEGFRL